MPVHSVELYPYVWSDGIRAVRAVGLAEQNSNGRHGLMYFDIVLRYQLLGTISGPVRMLILRLPLPPSLLTKASLLTISCLR